MPTIYENNVVLLPARERSIGATITQKWLLSKGMKE